MKFEESSHCLRIIISFEVTHNKHDRMSYDFMKDFDSINRKVMFAVLRHYGIPEPLVNAIRALYNNSKSAMMVDENISDPFEVSTGALQGDVLAPFLFIILDYLLKRLHQTLIQEW